jgi:glucosylceramidase
MLVTLISCAAATSSTSAWNTGRTDAPTARIAAAPSALGLTRWATTGDQTRTLSRNAFRATLHPAPLPIGAWDLRLDPSHRYQRFEGVGAALTESAAWVLRHQLVASERDRALRELFSSAGAGLDLVRLVVGTSDFARAHTTYDDSPVPDPSLSKFSIARDLGDVIPVAREIRAINPKVRFLASVWSPPAWMKQPQTLYGGTLATTYFASYARYLVKYLQAYASAGVPISWLSVQNEPLHEPTDYPGMRLSATDEKRFLTDFLIPRLVAAKLTTRILVYDHNWDTPSYPLTVLADAQVRAHAGGTAFHCYAGTPNSQAQLRHAYPALEIWMTECSGGNWSTDFGANLVWNADNLLIGSTKAYGSAIVLWNLALDESGGPHSGGCSGCRGVITVVGATTRHEVEFAALGQIGVAVRPGAQQIALRGTGAAHTVAFRNTDGHNTLIAVNDGWASQRIRMHLGSWSFDDNIPPRSVVTWRWDGLAGY